MSELLKRHFLLAILTSPVLCAFLFSILLSFVAVLGDVTIGKDSAFYLDIAKDISDQGLSIAQERFDWPGFIIVLSVIHKVTGVNLEAIGYTVCSLLMAGTSAVMVQLIRLVRQDLAPWGILAVISVPAINGFREDILREYGFWFFSILSLLFAVLWQRQVRWYWPLLINVSIVLAASFRLEAIFLWPAFFLWIVLGVGCNRLYRLVLFFSFPFLMFCFFVFYYFEYSDLYSRIVFYVELIDPQSWIQEYSNMVRVISESLFSKYLQDEIELILFFLLFLIVLSIFLKGLGIWLVVFFNGFGWQSLCFYWKNHQLMAISFLLYFCILVVFLIELKFLNTRYVSFLHLLSIPLLAYAMDIFFKRSPRFGMLIITLFVLTALANVVSLGAKKTHYIEAGQWIEFNLPPDTRLFVADERIRYYAGRGYRVNQPTADQLISDDFQGQYDNYVLEAKLDDTWLTSWLQKNHQQILAAFANKKGDSVVITGPR